MIEIEPFFRRLPRRLGMAALARHHGASVELVRLVVFVAAATEFVFPKKNPTAGSVCALVALFAVEHRVLFAPRPAGEIVIEPLFGPGGSYRPPPHDVERAPLVFDVTGRARPPLCFRAGVETEASVDA